MTTSGKIVFANNLEYLRSLPSESVGLIYIDPPFNTGSTRVRTTLSTVRDDNGDRIGFQGRRYSTVKQGTVSYDDDFSNFGTFLIPRLRAARRILTPTGSIFVHLDPRESHYCKIWLDEVFGRASFINEIVWAYDYGGRGKDRWPAKHDNILWYAKDPEDYVFNYDAIDRIPYMAPGLVTPEKVALGKVPTDTWWNTIVSPNGKEKTGYPTQKPLAILERIVKVHSKPNDVVLDFFAGSGSMGEAAARNGREFILVDNNPAAIGIIRNRLAQYHPEYIVHDMGEKKGTGRLRPAEPSRKTKSLTHVIAVTVSNYQSLKPLTGPKQDAKLVERLFLGDEFGVFGKTQVELIHDPTLEVLQNAIVKFRWSEIIDGRCAGLLLLGSWLRHWQYGLRLLPC